MNQTNPILIEIFSNQTKLNLSVCDTFETHFKFILELVYDDL